MVNVTPGAFRIMSKEIHKIDSKDEVKITEDASFVFSKSKYFLGSTGTVWASHFMRLRYQEPQCFEINNETANLRSKQFQCICTLLSDKISYFIDSSEESDVMKIEKN